MFPLEFPLVSLIVLVEFLFGIGFNSLVGWAHKNKIWHVSVSVMMGVAVTLLIPALVLTEREFYFWQASLFYLVCFIASGLPMVFGSTRRTVKESHQRRPLPNHAMQVRDDVVMELKLIIDEIVQKKAEVAMVIHRLHELVGKLRGL